MIGVKNIHIGFVGIRGIFDGPGGSLESFRRSLEGLRGSQENFRGGLQDLRGNWEVFRRS